MVVIVQIHFFELPVMVIDVKFMLLSKHYHLLYDKDSLRKI